MSEQSKNDTYWYESRGNKHYFLQAEKRDDGLYYREVTPLISQDNRGYYRVRPWKKVKDNMVDQFHDDHKERDRPSRWDGARIEQA